MILWLERIPLIECNLLEQVKQNAVLCKPSEKLEKHSLHSKCAHSPQIAHCLGELSKTSVISRYNDGMTLDFNFSNKKIFYY